MQQIHCRSAVSTDDNVGIPDYLEVNSIRFEALEEQMSTLILTRSPGAAAPRKGFFRNKFFRMIAEFIDGVRLARAMAHHYDVLSRKSDVELAAFGIRREDIPSIVVNAKYHL
jgi:hypothetical protein